VAATPAEAPIKERSLPKANPPKPELAEPIPPSGPTLLAAAPPPRRPRGRRWMFVAAALVGGLMGGLMGLAVLAILDRIDRVDHPSGSGTATPLTNATVDAGSR